jgi:hypothetical protein
LPIFYLPILYKKTPASYLQTGQNWAFSWNTWQCEYHK